MQENLENGENENAAGGKTVARVEPPGESGEITHSATTEGARSDPATQDVGKGDPATQDKKRPPRTNAPRAAKAHKSDINDIDAEREKLLSEKERFLNMKEEFLASAQLFLSNAQASGAGSEGATPLLPTPQKSIQDHKIVDIKKGLDALGMESPPHDCYPHPAHVKAFSEFVQSYEKLLGFTGCFVAPSSLDARWYTEEEVKRIGLSKKSGHEYSDDPTDKLLDAFRDMGDEKAGKKHVSSISMSVLIVFLFRIFILHALTNNLSRVGGPMKFVSYIYSLSFRCMAEKLRTTILLDTTVRTQIHQKSSCGELLCFTSEASAIMTSSIARCREVAEREHSAALAEKAATGKKSAPPPRNNNNYRYQNNANYKGGGWGQTSYPSSQNNANYYRDSSQVKSNNNANNNNYDSVSITSLVLEDFPPSYTKEMGESFKKIAGLGNVAPQPLGVWGSFCDAPSTEFLLRSAFETPFPIGQPCSLPEWLEQAVQFSCTHTPDEVRSHSLKMLDLLSSIEKSTRGSPFETRWRESQPDSVRMVTKIYPHAILEIAAHCGLDATDLVECFRTGFPLVGEMSAPNVFPRNPKQEGDPPCPAPRDTWTAFEKRPPAPSELSREIVTQTEHEVSLGWLCDPRPLRDFDWDRDIACHRFALQQGEKVRCCDDLRRSGTNARAAPRSQVTLPGITTLADIACRCAPAKNVLLWKADHRDAYKQLPADPAHSLKSVVVFRDRSGKLVGAPPRTLVFGSSLAVLGYNLVSRFICAIYCLFFKLPLIAFYDDYAGAAHQALGRLPLYCFERLNEVFGFSLKDEKSLFGKSVPFLGLQLSLLGPCPLLVLPDEKRLKYRTQIVNVLKCNKFTAAEADPVCGRLLFCESSIFGRACRAYLVPLFKQKLTNSSCISGAVRRSLKWFVSFLDSPKSKWYLQPEVRHPSIVVFTDASTTGLGVCICWPCGYKSTYSSRVPYSFEKTLPKGSSLIYVLEIWAVFFAVSTLVDKYPHGNTRHVVLLIDNTAFE